MMFSGGEHAQREGRTRGRMVEDCRDLPSESGCSLTISGEPDEVLTEIAVSIVSIALESPTFRNLDVIRLD